jgi:GntR family transcriptional repressor for pyruvate dehydrogenase complex
MRRTRLGNFSDEARADVEFHNAVSECAHNIILLHTLRSCYKLHMNGVFYNRTLLYGMPGVRAALLTQHEAIADAILGHDPEAGAGRVIGSYSDMLKHSLRWPNRRANGAVWRRCA